MGSSPFVNILAVPGEITTQLRIQTRQTQSGETQPLNRLLGGLRGDRNRAGIVERNESAVEEGVNMGREDERQIFAPFLQLQVVQMMALFSIVVLPPLR